MKTNSILRPSFSHPGIEAYIINLSSELIDFAEIQGKEDAQKESLTETAYNIKVWNPVQAKIQTAIDFIRNTLLPTSKVFDATEIEQAAQKKMLEITNEINHRLHKQASLKRKIEALILDPLKTKYGKWFIAIALIVGAADGALSYISFRHGSYPVLLAAVSAVAIASVISVSHLIYAGWVKRATANFWRMIRILLILSLAFAFFVWLSDVRADAANSTVNIALDGNNVSAESSGHLNGWAICIISFVLFMAVLFLSLLFWKTKKERLNEQEYNKLKAEIDKINAEIKELENSRIAIENNASIQKREARMFYDYATNSIRVCKNIGVNTITKYKQTYARFHHDILPDFFDEPHAFTYDDSFHFYKPAKPIHQ